MMFIVSVCPSNVIHLTIIYWPKGVPAITAVYTAKRPLVVIRISLVVVSENNYL